jgi:hypothetical protein
VLASDPVAAAQDPAVALLDRAALLTAARRAGRRPDDVEPLPVCEADARPEVSRPAAVRLARLLGEYPGLLAEWLTAAAAAGLRPPPRHLPELLDRARRAGTADPGLMRLVAAAGGPRARWLAGLNPDWALPSETGEEAWRLGDAGQRRGYLASLLAGDPNAARELVRSSWDAAGPAERAMFLSVLADRLDPADEPLLEAALDDRSEDVRAWGSYLLARLPGSSFARRMAGLALRCVQIERAARGPRLVITPPTDCDASMRRDGITPAPAAGAPHIACAPPHPRSPADRTGLLLKVVARTPLPTWTGAFGLTAAQVVALRSGDWAPVLSTGWALAARAQRDRDWTAALISQAITGRPPGTAAETDALRLLARQADPALGAPDALPEPRPDSPPVIGAALSLLRFRYDMLKELDDDSGD